MQNRRNRRSLGVLAIAMLATAMYAAVVIAPSGAATKPPPPPSHPAGNDDIALIVLANMARSEPSADRNGTEPVQPPLLWNDDLFAASLAHSEDMAENHCYQHNSCNGTLWWKRIESYYGKDHQWLGENINAVGNPEELHNGWMGSPGHRANILNGQFNEMGGGLAVGIDGFGPITYGTEDFAMQALRSMTSYPKIPAGAILPRQGSSTDARQLLVNVFDFTNGVDSVNAVVNGQSVPMALYRGTNKNGTYRVMKTIGGNGCVPMYFEAHLGATTYRWPESNSILVGVNRTDCAERSGSGTSTTTTVPRATGVPRVTIASPLAGTVHGAVTIRATATDDKKVARMEVWVDDRMILRRNASSISRQWMSNAKAVHAGSHTIVVKAYDDHGQVGTASVTVTK